MLFEKYNKYLKYVNGVPTDEYKQGERIGIESYDSQYDCENAVLYKWEDTGKTMCFNYNVYNQLEKFRSLDKGVTWYPTREYKAGNTLIEANSKKCGWELQTRWTKTGKVICEGALAKTEYIKEISVDMGKTWNIVLPEEYKYEEASASETAECVLKSDPLTYYVHIEDKNTTITSKDFLMLDTYKVIINWGDTIHNDEPADKQIHNHTYASAGDYIIKIWGIAINIGGFTMTKGYCDVISWGTSYTSQYPKLVILPSSIRNITDKNNIALKNITTFLLENNSLFTEIPPKLFDKSTHLIQSRFKNTKITKVPAKLYENTIQWEYSDAFSNCSELVTVEDGAFYHLDDLEHHWYTADSEGYTKCEYPLVIPEEDPGPILDYQIGYTTTRSVIAAFDGYNNFSRTFANCPKLTTVGNILKDNSKVLSCEEMFLNCKSLTNVSQFLKNTIIGGIYEGVYKVRSLDFSGIKVFDTSHCEGFSFKRMFYNCINLPNALETGTIQGPEHFYQPNTGSYFQWYNKPGYLHLRDNEEMYGNSGIVGANLLYIPAASGERLLYEEPSNKIMLKTPFKGCTKLLQVSGRSYIQYHAPRLCENITSLTSISDIYLLDAEKAFSNCGSLTRISNVKLENNAVLAFNKCYSLTEIPYDLFPNSKNLNADSCFKDCISLLSIPNNIFDLKKVFGDKLNINNMFYRCIALSSYPVQDNIPIWGWERFYDSSEPLTYKKTLAFARCPLIAAQVPYTWGGTLFLDDSDFTFTVKTTSPNEQVEFNVDYYKIFINTNNYKTYVDDPSISRTAIIFDEAGTYLVRINYSETYYVFPSLTVSIDNCGVLTDINIDHAKPNILYIGTGKNLFKTRTNLNDIFRDCVALKDVDDNIFLNCSNVSLMSYPFKNCALPESKILTILNKITSLTDASYILASTPYTTTFDIMKNNPGIIKLNYAFAYMPNLKAFPTYFSKGINDFSYAFANCNIQGESPRNQEGYKLWELEGMPGYPTTITPGHCFHGCLLLTDYNRMPDYWY